ncbi:hypothetical protein CL621_00960 [archaeon]|nr:hypothetical protein [archaeon]|tara:strand:- start:1134 stop:1448 length:315 start_codon:yes stop_codon:yes gene_type:complete
MTIKKQINTINDELFEKEPKGSLEDKKEVMYWNLWKQFGLKKEGSLVQRIRLKSCEFRWTPELKKEFYSIEWHSKVKDKLIELKEWQTWEANFEPICQIDSKHN